MLTTDKHRISLSQLMILSPFVLMMKNRLLQLKNSTWYMFIAIFLH